MLHVWFRRPLNVAAVAVTVWSALPCLGAALPVWSYELNSKVASVGFAVGNFVVMTVEGQFRDFSGVLQVAEPFSASHLEATVKTASLDTDNKDRDEHLRTADFFESAKYPDMTFTSTAVSGTPEAFEVKGKITIKGISKDLTLTGHPGEAPGEFVAEGRINRQDFGVSYGPTIKDEVKLQLKAKLVK